MSARNTFRNTGTVNAASIHVGDRTTIRVSKGGRRAVPYPEGSIGADLPKRNYVKYLVERYHHYREADVNAGRLDRLQYAVLFKSVERKFKAPTYFIPTSRFEELVDFLHSRIDKTILGQRNMSRGIRNHESFDEYKLQHMGKAHS
jgi:hypothetical protein